MQTEAINPRLVKFIIAAVIFFAWTCIQGAVMGPMHEFLQLGPAGMIQAAHSHLGCSGWTGFGLMAAIYCLLPIISGKSIVWPKLIEWIFWIFVVCVTIGSILMIIAGVVGGSALAAGAKGPQLSSIIMLYAMPAGLLCTISVIAGLMFVVQILVSLARSPKAA
jgi:cbb3-type cytochrome oxidase subunit 1